MTNSSSENYYQHDELQLKQILIFLYRGKWFFLLVLSLVAITTYIYLKTVVPSYEASIVYRLPSEISVSKINNARFRDKSLIPGSLENLSRGEIYKMFDHKIFSTDFRKKVFRDYGYSEKINSNDPLLMNDYIGRIRLNKIDSDIGTTTLYMRGSEPSILSDFLNDLLLEANKSTLQDIEQIELNIIENRLHTISWQEEREMQILKEKRIEDLKILNENLVTAKSANIYEIDFDKVSVVYQNQKLYSDTASETEMEVFPLWYFYGEKFLEKEIEKLKIDSNLSNKNLIALRASKNALESFTIDLTGIEVADIAWSVVPTTPYEPKKRLIMISVLFIAFLISIFLWYVIGIFRGSK